MYTLPNRKLFSDAITRIFIKKRYRDRDSGQVDPDDADVDFCLKSDLAGSKGTELLPHQKLVRDYLLIETPYRGVLAYHGLGSGKTATAVAVAESLLDNKKIHVLLPAALETNFIGEIRKVGDPIYRIEQYWESKAIRSAEDRAEAKAFGLSDGFLDKHGRYFVNVRDRPSNFGTLAVDQQKVIAQQIEDLIGSRFNFIRYNGLSSLNIDKVLPPDRPDLFDNSVIIIDEAHNLIGGVVNERGIKQRLYDMVYRAKNSRVVCLSGTPIVNNPIEIAVMMNLIRGPIERVIIPTKQAISWDEGLMTVFFRAMKDVDTIEYDSVKRIIKLTRNPPHFESVYSEKNERIAVKYNKDFPQEPDIVKWVDTWKDKFQKQFGGTELEETEKIGREDLECLPSKFEDFANTFIDGLSVKNPFLFMRRIQGLVSYYKAIDERLLPKRLDTNPLVKVPMSDGQFIRYLEKRDEEIKQESKRGRSAGLNEDFSSYRMGSRQICNYAVPAELKPKKDTVSDESEIISTPEILEVMRKTPEKYFSNEGLAIYSPKMLEMMKRLKENMGSEGNFNNQFVYSFYKTLEGLGIFAAVLDYNGFQKYRLVKTAGGVWEEDPSMKSGVPAYGTFTGNENAEERELLLQIYNQDYSDTFPASLKESIKERRLCVILGSKSIAEGITLKNVRVVHVMESNWNPAITNQVIGRAIRLCSHARLPVADRTVTVFMYITVFSEEQKTTTEGPNIVMIRRNDTDLKRYEGEPRESFMSSDEFLYEKAFRKEKIANNISHLLKQAAVDCEIHRKLHSKEQPVIQCMRFDTTAGPEDMAFKPNILADERDTLYMRNIKRVKRRLQIVRVKGELLVLDPDTNEIFDYGAFEDNKRLLRLGSRISQGEIRFFG